MRTYTFYARLRSVVGNVNEEKIDIVYLQNLEAFGHRERYEGVDSNGDVWLSTRLSKNVRARNAREAVKIIQEVIERTEKANRKGKIESLSCEQESADRILEKMGIGV